MAERTEISSLGEFGLIEYLTKNIEIQNASSILGSFWKTNGSYHGSFGGRSSF
jgi:hypothetical protein